MTRGRKDVGRITHETAERRRVQAPPLRLDNETAERRRVQAPPLRLDSDTAERRRVQAPPLRLDGETAERRRVQAPPLRLDNETAERRRVQAPPLRLANWRSLALIATFACASSGTIGGGGGGPLSDEKIEPESMGLVEGSPLETHEPPRAAYRTSIPGEEPLIGRAYRGTPPMIPHGLEEVTPVTRSDHPCQECHQIAEQYQGDPTPLPESHYTDYRARPPRRDAKLMGAWSDCQTCHLRQSDAPDLVENTFVSIDELETPKAPTPEGEASGGSKGEAATDTDAE